jgi:hypothetical protein
LFLHASSEGVRKHNGSAYKEKPVENVLPKNEFCFAKKGRFCDIKEHTTPCIFFYPIAVGMIKNGTCTRIINNGYLVDFGAGRRS